MKDQLLKNGKYIAIAGSLLFLFICYQLAFYRTIEALTINHALQSNVSGTSDLADRPGALNRQMKNLTRALSQYESDSSALRANSLTTISSVAKINGTRLEEVPLEDPLFHSPQFTVQRLAFSGDFNGLVKTLYQLESTNNIGKVRSVSMQHVKVTREELSQKILMDLLIEIGK